MKQPKWIEAIEGTDRWEPDDWVESGWDAGGRGVSKVEVQVDGGEWREAQLRAPLTGLTWVIWRYDWTFHMAGAHSRRAATTAPARRRLLKRLRRRLPAPAGCTA